MNEMSIDMNDMENNNKDKKSLKAKLIQYLPLLGEFILAGLLIVIGKIFERYYSPHQWVFSPVDPNIAYPNTKETINNVWLWVLSGLFPLVIFLGCALWKRDWRWGAEVLLGLLISLSTSYLITHITKNLVGRLRPDFLDRCQPLLDTESNKILITISSCQQSNLGFLRAGQQSFFSGHSSTSFSGLGYLTLILISLTSAINRPRVDKLVISLAPLMVAWFIALSRVTDYRHHPSDVGVGIIVGILCAVIAYKGFLYRWCLITSKRLGNGIDTNNGVNGCSCYCRISRGAIEPPFNLRDL